MAIITQGQRLDIRPGAPQAVVHISQGDVGSNLQFYLYNSGEPFQVTGLTASVHGVRFDGVGWGPYAATIVSGVSNAVRFALRSVMSAVAGPGLAEITLSDNGSVIGTANFAILVEPGTFANGPVYSNDISVYQQILAYVTSTVIPTGAVTIDSSLSLAGAAAEAKAVGDALAAVNASISGVGDRVATVETPLAVKVAGTYTSATRGIFIPYTFEKGHTYRLDLQSASTLVSYIRITRAATINTADNIKQWTINAGSASREYVCEADDAAYIAVVAPAGIALESIKFALYEGGPLAQVDSLTGRVDDLETMYETEYEVITAEASNPGYRWGTDGKTLLATANMTAWQFAPTSKRYILQGLQVGTLEAAAVYFMTADDRIISSISSATQGDGHTLTIDIPDGCALVRYSTSTNATWDAAPKKQVNVPVSVSLDRYLGAELYGTYTSNTRAIFIPFSFVNDTGYYIRLLHSAETPASIRVTKAATLNSGDIIASWSVNSTTADVSYYCNTHNAAYIAIVCDSSVTANAVTVEVVKDGALSEADKLNSLLGVEASGRYASQSRAIIVPCDFKSGKTYYIEVSSTQILTTVRVAKQPTLNSTDAVISWATNGRKFDKTYVPSNNDGKYLILIAGSEVTSITADVKILTNDMLLSDDFNALPYYYYTDNYWPNVIDRIRTRTQILNGVAFAFVTDIHFDFNAGNSPLMLKDILAQTTVPYVICGGDFPQAYGTRDDLIKSGNALVDYRDTVGADRFFCVRGNHDFTIKSDSGQTTGDPDTGATLPVDAAYNYICRQQERFLYCSSPDHMAWYIDIPCQRTRIVGLNSCDGQGTDETASWAVDAVITQAQLEWLVNVALSEDGYRYIFISHIPADPALHGYSSSQSALHQILTALENKTAVTAGGVSADFTDSTSTVICHITGHSHRDESNVDDNLLSITTTCDAFYTDDGHEAVRGTITEQAFDVYCINFDTKEIYAVRAGRGTDRSWNYV